MARIGILGGTFNPIHNGHLMIARAACLQYELDRILFIPAGTPPHKEVGYGVSARQRLAMAEAAVADEKNFSVSDYEICQPQKSYTYKTLDYLCEKFPENQYYFIIGEDSLRTFSSWRFPEKITAMAQILVAVRQDAASADMECLQRELEENSVLFGPVFHLLKTENIPISSTEIRSNIYKDDNVKQWIPPRVYDYIREHGLYRQKVAEYDLEAMEGILKKELTPSRYGHTLGVMYTAASLAMRYLYPIPEAMTAGLLHDCAKCLSDEKRLKICEKNGILVSELERRYPQLLHAKVGAFLAETKYGITDKTILHAIKVHTTGCEEMSLLDQIVFVADYIEPGRNKASRLADIRQMAFLDLNRCCGMILQDTMEYLSTNAKSMDQTTAKAFSYYQKFL